jgi:hypothetical protein
MLVIITYENLTYDHLAKYTTFSTDSTKNANYQITTESDSLFLYEYASTNFTSVQDEGERLLKIINDISVCRGIYINTSNGNSTIENLTNLCIYISQRLPIDYLTTILINQQSKNIGEWDFSGNFYPDFSIASNLNIFDFVFISSESSPYRNSILMLIEEQTTFTSIGMVFKSSESESKISSQCKDIKNVYEISNLNGVLFI